MLLSSPDDASQGEALTRQTLAGRRLLSVSIACQSLTGGKEEAGDH